MFRWLTRRWKRQQGSWLRTQLAKSLRARGVEFDETDQGVAGAIVARLQSLERAQGVADRALNQQAQLVAEVKELVTEVKCCKLLLRDLLRAAPARRPSTAGRKSRSAERRKPTASRRSPSPSTRRSPRPASAERKTGASRGSKAP
jgi:hypothetical protein